MNDRSAPAARERGGGAPLGARGLRSQPVERVLIDVLSFPLDPPFRASVRLISTVDCILCRVMTKDGLEGAGYSFAFGAEEARALAAIMRLLADRLIGMDVAANESTWSALWSSLALLGQPGAGVTALAALDIAIWDIRGKAVDAPLYRLLGTARESIPTYGSGGSLDATIDQLTAEMADYVEVGHRAVKMKLGCADDCERVKAVRDALGPGPRLILDATQKWTPKEALAAARRLERFESAFPSHVPALTSGRSLAGISRRWPGRRRSRSHAAAIRWTSAS